MLRNYSIFWLGIPVRVWIWILIAIFLGLIFHMITHPEFWRKLFSKKHKERIEQRKNGNK